MICIIQTTFFWQSKEAIPEEALLASCRLERCQDYWKSSETLAAKLYQVSAWTCMSGALQRATYRQLHAGRVPGSYVDPPAHHLPTFLSPTLLSLVPCQALKHRGTSTSQVSGCEKIKDCEEPVRVFSHLIFRIIYYSAEIFQKSSTQWTDPKLKFRVEWLKSIKTQCNDRQGIFRGKILHLHLEAVMPNQTVSGKSFLSLSYYCFQHSKKTPKRLSILQNNFSAFENSNRNWKCQYLESLCVFSSY